MKAVVAITCIIVAVLCTVLIAAAAIYSLRGRVIAAHAVRTGNYSGDLILRILRSKYPGRLSRRYVFRRIRLSVPVSLKIADSDGSPLDLSQYTPQSAAKFCGIDYLVVGRGGITLIASSSMGGYIENPMRGDWRQFVNGSAKQFLNPLEQSSFRLKILSAELRRAGFPSVPMNTVLVFTSPEVRFKNRFARVIGPERLPEVIDQINGNRFLSIKEMNRLARFIEKNYTDKK